MFNVGSEQIGRNYACHSIEEKSSFHGRQSLALAQSKNVRSGFDTQSVQRFLLEDKLQTALRRASPNFERLRG